MRRGIRDVLGSITALVVLSAPPAFADDIKTGVAAACDALAASPYDPATPPGTGVAFADINASSAITACASAVEVAPGDGKLRFQLARSYDAAEQFDEAIANYRAAADLGSAVALSSLGSLYETGLGVPADLSEAARLYQKAADEGITFAMENLGKLYEDGRGVSQDYARAAELYHQAAEMGSPYAMGLLGWLTLNGFGQPKDDVEAARLYRVAADGGVDFAQHDLGVMYAKGQGGLAQSYVEAFKYYSLAAAQHWAVSYVSLAECYSHGNGVAKDIAKAEEYLLLAIAEGDEKVQGDARNDLAWMFATENIRLEEAEQLARQAVAASPETATRLDTLSWVLHLTGRNEEALPLAEKALELNASSATYQKHLAEIRTALGK